MIEWGAQAISSWAAYFATVERREAADLWMDVEKLANQYLWAAAKSSSEAAVAWHHLVLAVGNFKRQTPIRLSHLPIPDLPNRPVDRITIPENGLAIKRDGPWDALLEVKGIKTATATAILAALWPKHHMVFDEKVLHIGNALLVEQDDGWLHRTNSPFPERAWRPTAKPYRSSELLPTSTVFRCSNWSGPRSS